MSNSMLDPAMRQIEKLGFFSDELFVRGDRDQSTAWWSQTGSNRRPHACKARALPTELWPHSPQASDQGVKLEAGRSKPMASTSANARRALLRVNRSHSERTKMVGLGRLELPTSRLSSARSNQLSYKPKISLA
jgi:hypothetical protein